MQYRKNILFLVLCTSVYSIQTTDKSDTNDKLSLRSALVELAAGFVIFFFSKECFCRQLSPQHSNFSCLLSQLDAVAGAQQVALIQTYADSKTSSARDEGEVLFGAASFSLSIPIHFSILKCPIALTVPYHIYLFILSLFFFFFFLSES